MAVIDPRSFKPGDREPVKKRRDFEQTEAAGLIASRYLQKPFDGPDLAALPNALRELAPKITDAVSDDGRESTGPNW